MAQAAQDDAWARPGVSAHPPLDLIAVDFSRVPKPREAEEHGGKLSAILGTLWNRVQQGDGPSTAAFVKEHFLDVPDGGGTGIFSEFISDADLQAVSAHTAGLLEACFTDDALASLKSSELMINAKPSVRPSFAELSAAGKEIAQTFCVDARGWKEFNARSVGSRDGTALPVLPTLSALPIDAHTVSRMASTEARWGGEEGGLKATLELISTLAFSGGGLSLGTLLACGQCIHIATFQMDAVLLMS
eukprot:3933448-Rhodomonas_salina.1